MSLQDCIRQAGKALSPDDATAIQALVESGMDETQAVETYLSEIDTELADVVTRAVEAGATVVEPELAAGSEGAAPGTGAEYTVRTEDAGDVRVRVLRRGGGVSIVHDNGIIDYNAAFAEGKTDEEILRYAYEPQGVQDVLLETAPTELEQSAFHGTPHTFDKFSLEAIGTGEGAAAFGWGLYFAQRREIAEYYRDVLAERTIETAPERLAFEALRAADGDVAQAQQLLLEREQRAQDEGRGFQSEDILQAVGLLETGWRPAGNLVEVDLPEDSELLDWDAPLSEQPAEVREALTAAGFRPEQQTGGARPNPNAAADQAAILQGRSVAELSPEELQAWNDAAMVDAAVQYDPTGQELYEELSEAHGSDQAASDYLNSIGIPGLRYRDAGSRFGDGDSRNYVIWDEDVVSVRAVNDEMRQAEELKQGPRGTFNLETQAIRLTEASDLSTFLHESGHLFLDMEARLAAKYGLAENNRALLGWLGVESFAEITPEHHEKFAETFEVYLREGKAPSLALRDAFAAFARWLSQVYKTIVGDPRLERAQLDPEIRQVMDRLLATEQEIAEASGDPMYDQFFESAESAGMTPAQWEAYKEKRAKVKERATADLNEQITEQIRQRLTKEWQDEKKRIADRKREELAAQPIYQIISDLKDAPMDYDRVNEILGTERPTGRLIGKTKRGGVDPELYAETYGYDNVRTMLEEVLAVPGLKEASEMAAEAEMKAKHGDILNDGTIEELAREAMHSEAQVDTVLTEIKALDRKAPDINRAYLKAEAKAMIAGMTYRQIQPNRFYQAEIRAAKRAATETSPALKREAKIQQLVNHYLYKEARETKAAMEKWRRHVRRAQTRSYDTKQVAPGYVQNMKLLANLYEMRQGPEQQVAVEQILQWYNAQVNDPNQFATLELLDQNLVQALVLQREGDLGRLKLPTFEDLTAENLQGVYDMLRHLRYVGGTMSEQGRSEFERDKAALIAGIEDRGGQDRTRPDAPGRLDKTIEGWKHALHRLPSIRNLVRVLDGFQEDGPARRLIFKLLEDGHNRKLALQEQLYDRFREETEAVHRLGLGKTDPRTITTESGREFTLHSEGRFMLALYWGTETSREAIREGHGLTDGDVMRMLQYMTPEQLQLVNAVWRVNESLWPDLSGASTRLYGVAPPKLDPTPFTVNGVEMTGGHQRLFYDSVELEIKGEQQKGLDTSSIMPTKAGSLHARVGSGGRPVLLDRNNILRSYEEAIHFIAFAEPARRLAGLVNSSGVREVIQRKHGRGYYRALIDGIDGLASGRKPRESIPALAGLVRTLRRAATMKHLAYSIRNTVQQITALPLTMKDVGTGRLLETYGRFMTQREELTDMIKARSTFMKQRTSLVNREAAEYLRGISVGGQFEHVWDQFSRYGFTPQTIVDSLIAYPAWLAKYEQSLELHGDVDRAVSDADTMVAESVGSGAELHLGGVFQRNNSELVRMLTVFGSWFNAYYQRLYRSSRGGQDYMSREFLSAAVTMPMLLGVMSAVAIMDMPQDEDDPEDWVMWALARYGAFLGGTVPIVRDIVSSFSGFSPKSVLSGGSESPARFINEIDALIEGRQTAGETVTDISKVVTTVLPIPGSGQVIRISEAWQEGTGQKSPTAAAYQAVVEGPERNE